MYGIGGFTQLRSQSADVTELMRRMSSPLTPRGPDGEEFHVAPGIALSHRRLSNLAPLFRTFEMELGSICPSSANITSHGAVTATGMQRIAIADLSGALYAQAVNAARALTWQPKCQAFPRKGESVFYHVAFGRDLTRKR